MMGELVKNSEYVGHMSSPSAQWVIEHPAQALTIFVEAVEKRNRIQVSSIPKIIVKKTLKVWKTIRVGATSKYFLINAIEEVKENKEKNEISKCARDIMGKPAFKIAPSLGEVGLISLTPSDLDFTSPPRTDAFMTKEFCAKWSAENLDVYVIELCEPEDGPLLRLQYQDQPKGEILWMAMERIVDSSDHPRVFGAEHCDVSGRRLLARWTDPNNAWSLDSQIVFRFRKLPLPSIVPVPAQA